MHRTRVYRFGVAWHWRCYRPGCAGGPSRTWDGALEKARFHVWLGGYVPIPEYPVAAPCCTDRPIEEAK